MWWRKLGAQVRFFRHRGTIHRLWVRPLPSVTACPAPRHRLSWGLNIVVGSFRNGNLRKIELAYQFQTRLPHIGSDRAFYPPQVIGSGI